MTDEIALRLGEFARLLLGTSAAADPARTITLGFDGTTAWLKHCQAAVQDLPGVSRDGPADIVITDSATGSGWYFALIPFGVLAFLLPLSVSGLGAGVASFVPLFALAGLPREGVLGNLPGGILMVLGSNSSRSGLASSLHK